ncbi:hypothetical protein [Frondihabitans sp. PAMC 28766]|uniref:hypothetical protein n=1 Tax=Frondihabitans sp. PAMC 28766 TaxID=1795630 RepID=UPI0012FFCEAC|nr:hypothetical protein [Frondihabitans sp. PAMC 28766]
MTDITEPIDTEITLDVVFTGGAWVVQVKGAGEVTAANLEEALELGEAEARRAGLLGGEDWTLAWSTTTTPEAESLVRDALESDAAAEEAIEQAYDDALAAVVALRNLGLKKRDIADILNIEKSAVTDYLAEEALGD